jgi:amino acid adenylation domain-containing protein
MSYAVPLVSDFLTDSAWKNPEKIGLVSQNQKLSYRELEAGSNALAHALVNHGVMRGDRVMVFGDNTIETVLSFWAILKANAIAVIINPLTKADKLAYLLNDCRAKILITGDHLSSVFSDAAAKSTHLKTIVVSNKPTEAHYPLMPNWEVEDFDVLLNSFPAEVPPIRRNIDIDLAALIYTSGSTGDPKGVMVTHRNMITAANSITSYLENVPEDVILNVLPLSFDYGLYQMIMAFGVGARLILERSFSFPAEVLNHAVKEKVTGFPGVPTIFAILLGMKNLNKFDLSGVRYVTNTAAALPEKQIAGLKKIFPRAKIYSMYGLTECKRCTYLPPNEIDRKSGSVGIAIPNTEMWIIDEEGNKLGHNLVGQLVIRGATVMRGYWDKPEATARKLKPGPLPNEMVLYTGDLCRMDEDGYLYFVGRMDDIIKCRGEKVAPKEVEIVLMNVRGVKEAAVIGVPDDILGQAIKAFVVLESETNLTEMDLLRECARRLESFMVPQYIEFVGDLPKTNSGKIKKTGLQ